MVACAIPRTTPCFPDQRVRRHRHPIIDVRLSVSSHLQLLEGEAIYVLREVAAQFERPVLLFSGGKDSVVVAWLARKAFAPARNPFPLLHLDTGHNFPETLRRT